jgi:adenylate kinase family enzyme
MTLLKEIDNKIVVFGMSCSGKTTFSQSLKDHFYYCFDALFQWHLIETLNLSITENFKHIQNVCVADKFVLDGWHLADKKGKYLPKDCVVYVIWAPYKKIISQYRIPVTNSEEYWPMYNKWYCEIDYDNLPSVRYFENTDKFVEITREEFIVSSRQNQ